MQQEVYPQDVGVGNNARKVCASCQSLYLNIAWFH